MSNLNFSSGGLLSLAPELMQAISIKLDIRAFKSLRLTCKHLSESLAPQVLCSLTLDINQDTIAKEIPKLKAMGSDVDDNNDNIEGFCLNIRKHLLSTRQLTIRGLSPIFDPSYHCTWSYSNGRCVRNGPEPIIPPEAWTADEDVKKYLGGAITRMKGVQRVSWAPLTDDDEWSQTTVWDALKTLPNLRTLDLNLRYCKISLPLDTLASLGDLNAITLKNVKCSRESPQILDVFARMVAKSPKLTSIHLFPLVSAEDPKYSLHQVFKYWPSMFKADAPLPLRLHHLSLNSCLVRLDHITLPHLRHLQSIHLQSVIDPYDDDRRNNLNNGPQQREVGSSVDEFWRTLAAEEIWLEEIKHEDVGEGFLDYLEAYPTMAGPGPETGLKSLTLNPDSGYRGPSYSNPMARRFFSKQGPLIKHAKTLDELTIKSWYEGGWSFDMNNLRTLAMCANLKTFGMGIISGKIPYGEDSDDSKNTVKCLIDLAVLHMPHLETLHIYCSNLETLRNARCGNGFRRHHDRTNKRIAETVKRYTAPDSCQRLPMLVVPGTSEVMVGRKEQGKLMYVSTGSS